MRDEGPADPISLKRANHAEPTNQGRRLRGQRIAVLRTP